jgi:hypothetical protein
MKPAAIPRVWAVSPVPTMTHIGTALTAHRHRTVKQTQEKGLAPGLQRHMAKALVLMICSPLWMIASIMRVASSRKTFLRFNSTNFQIERRNHHERSHYQRNRRLSGCNVQGGRRRRRRCGSRDVSGV